MGSLLRRAALAAALTTPAPAAAYMIVPVEDTPGRYVVVIEAEVGEHVPLAALPRPYNRLDAAIWGDHGPAFQWRYFRSSERGRARLVFDESGGATMVFEFAGEALGDGDTIAAAVVLTGTAGRPLHTIHARGRVEGDRFAGGGRVHRARAPIGLPEGWRDEVAGFTFFKMKYYSIQNLDADGTATAMRRAVARVTGGEGSEQWAEDDTFAAD